MFDLQPQQNGVLMRFNTATPGAEIEALAFGTAFGTGIQISVLENPSVLQVHCCCCCCKLCSSETSKSIVCRCR